MSLKSTARRGGLASFAALTALALASCSAGQITQTSSQVAAVDGAWADSEDGTIAVRDVAVVLDEQDEAALKFTAVNQDESGAAHTLESVEVDGQEVDIDQTPTLQAECSLVADNQQGIEQVPQFEEGCLHYTATSMENENYPIGGNVPVVFTFDHTSVELNTPITRDQLPAGEFHREEMTDANTDNPPENH